MAPFFGASTIVWANTIGVVLVSLSVGYWLGGRFADRHPHRRGLCMLVLLAAVAVGLVPFAAEPFLDVSRRRARPCLGGAFVGSLVAVPCWSLARDAARDGLAVRDPAGGRAVEDAGTVAGRLYAISTAGSLVGTFAPALLLIPLVGTRRTFLVFGLACAWSRSRGCPPARGRPRGAGRDRRAARPAGGHDQGQRRRAVLEEVDTEYQYARVVEEPDGERRLELNEGQAVHSLYRPGSYLTGDYWDELAGAAVRGGRGAAAAGGDTRQRRRHDGARARALLPAHGVDAVEIDPELTGSAAAGSTCANPRLSVHHEDARPYLRRTDARYDVIVVDAYRQPYIPFYLVTREFFELVRDRLNPGGVVLVNIGHPEGEDDLEKVLTATMGAVFPTRPA